MTGSHLAKTCVGRHGPTGAIAKNHTCHSLGQLLKVLDMKKRQSGEHVLRVQMLSCGAPNT